MDQIKIGRFISIKRKELGLTQSELAEKLYVTDRAVSKWENGVCLPDVSNITELCEILNITINDLFSGRVVDMKENEKMLENNLMEMLKEKELKDKQLLSLEIVLGYICSLSFLAIIFIASYIEMEAWIRIILIIFGVIEFFIGMFYALKIEQVAGYYKCEKCNHRFVPTYKEVLFTMHINRTRYLKCPKCHEKSWCKKTLTK